MSKNPFCATDTSVSSMIAASPTAYHVVENALSSIKNIQLTEADFDWHIEYGNTYAITRNDASAIFVHVPKGFHKKNCAFDIAAVHTDSPALKVKDNPIVIKDGYIRLNVERYGGPLPRTWFDRPLSVAGRVFISHKGAIKRVLVDMADILRGVIPSLAPHMAQESDEKVSYQSHMMPIIGIADGTQSAGTLFNEYILAAIAKHYPDVSVEDILSFDLFVYDAERPNVIFDAPVGATAIRRNMLLSPRLDDQGCVWTSVFGFADADKDASASISVLALFDNEENGSACRAGADSTFLVDVISRIEDALDMTNAERYRAHARSFIVSADNAHAKHPAYPARADITNETLLGGGIVLKHSASQRYMTDGSTAAVFASMCRKSNIPYQHYYNNADVVGGSTLGNILSTQMSLPGIDIGLPQLAMHSANECVCPADIDSMQRFFEGYFSGQRDIRLIE